MKASHVDLQDEKCPEFHWALIPHRVFDDQARIEKLRCVNMSEVAPAIVDIVLPGKPASFDLDNNAFHLLLCALLTDYLKRIGKWGVPPGVTYLKINGRIIEGVLFLESTIIAADNGCGVRDGDNIQHGHNTHRKGRNNDPCNN